MAALITDPKGRILMARRLVGRDFAGYWEFPGGKIDPGETPEAALMRELKEELGIDAHIDEQVIVVPQHSPKALKLDVRRVRHWSGTPKGLDGQALAWVPLGKIAQYAVPPPDVSVIASLLEPDLLWITPSVSDAGGSEAWLTRLREVLALGVKRIQLRPQMGAADATDETLIIRSAAKLCQAASIDISINANIPLAKELGCGVHLKSSQLLFAQDELQALGIPLSASCHSAEELTRAKEIGCRYALLGPVAQTRSHPNTPPMGWTSFFDIRGHAPALPTYALGGMTPADMDTARLHGAQGIATISGI